MEKKEHMGAKYSTKKKWTNNKIKEIKKYIETIENESTTLQNLRNVAKAALRGKFKMT